MKRPSDASLRMLNVVQGATERSSGACSFCDGLGEIGTSDDGGWDTCPVCEGTGRSPQRNEREKDPGACPECHTDLTRHAHKMSCSVGGKDSVTASATIIAKSPAAATEPILECADCGAIISAGARHGKDCAYGNLAVKVPEKDPAAVSLGRRGGLKGGKARAAALTPERRREIARKAAAARWAKKGGT